MWKIEASTVMEGNLAPAVGARAGAAQLGRAGHGTKLWLIWKLWGLPLVHACQEGVEGLVSPGSVHGVGWAATAG